jgi:hypothetical protein
VIIAGRSRVGSTPRGEQARSGPCRASRVYTHQPSTWAPSGTTRVGSLTTSLTPSLNPKMTLIKFMCHVTPRVSVYFFLIFGVQHYFFFIFHIFFLQLIWRTSSDR